MTKQRHGGPTIEERQRAASRAAQRDIDKNLRMMARNDSLLGESRTPAKRAFGWGRSARNSVERVESTGLRPYLYLLLIAAVIGAVIGMVVSGL
ncbi:hypothetical protein KHP62_01020 [Rhodobacteraceae bacterium NNCM2]|nr:hypothetical protein [Coraliihabitans acroporae]